MSSSGTVREPIPSKVSNMNGQYGYLYQNKVVPLEELVDDCFKYSIGQLTDPNRVDVVRRFGQYTVDLHCHENLSFLIEIFKYEYYYDKIVYKSEEGTKGIEGRQSYLNLSLLLSTGALPYPKKATRRMFERKRSSAGVSIKSEDHEPMSVFASTIDDLDERQHGHEMNNVWDNWMEKNVSESGSEDESDAEDGDGGADKGDMSTSEQELITGQWNFIMDRYMHHNSPEQINLSNRSYKEIMEENDRRNIFHSPIVLVQAKDEVIRLIEENAYHLFVNTFKSKDSRTSSPLIQAKRDGQSPSSLVMDECPKSKLLLKSASANILPVLTPTSSNVPKLFNKKNKSKFLYLSSSSNNLPIESGSNSSSSSASSLSNILDHLRLNTNHTNSPLNASPIQTPDQSKAQSLSTSPLYTKEDKFSKFGKIWRQKKNN